MKLNSFQESVVLRLIQWLNACLSRLPVSVRLACGRLLGRLISRLGRKQRKLAYRNLFIALGATHSPEDIKSLYRRFYDSFGMNIVELLCLPQIYKEGVDRYVSIDSVNHLHNALSRGKGLILLSMHSGNWELSSLAGSAVGLPYNMVANHIKRVSRIDALLNSYRTIAGAQMIHPGIGSRNIIKALKRNEVVVLVADQGGRDGDLTDFFDRQASMSNGAVRLALKYDVPIVLVDIQRDEREPHKHLLKTWPALELIRTQNRDQDVRANVEQITKHFIAQIKDHPHEYMWIYKIWKFDPKLRLTILNDGRTGHLRQSEAVAEVYTKIAQNRSKAILCRTINVEFKSEGQRRLLAIKSMLARMGVGFNGYKVLKQALSDRCLRELYSRIDELVVSCGSTVAAINYFFARDVQARNIAIMNTGLISLKYFTRVIVPQHDCKSGVKLADNVIVTKAAPNLITDDYLKEHEKKLLERYSHLKHTSRKRIAVCIGGDAGSVRFTVQQAAVMVRELKNAANHLNADLLITTSRRTSNGVERLLLSELKKFDHCPLLIVANKNNSPYAVGGILSLADFAVVTGDSISMISEAVCSKTPVVVVPLTNVQHQPLNNKYKRFIDGLVSQSILLASDTHHLAQALDQLAKKKITMKLIDDQQRLYETLSHTI